MPALMFRTSEVISPLPVAEKPLTLPSGLPAVQVKVAPAGLDVNVIAGEPPEQTVAEVIVLAIAGTGLTSATKAVLVGLGHPAGIPISTASA